MRIAVALDGSRRRDLEFYESDDSVIEVVAYQNDGDSVPISVLDVRMTWGRNDNTIESGVSFVSDFDRRSTYHVTGMVGAEADYVDPTYLAPDYVLGNPGALTTLAYGLINRGWDDRPYACCYTGWIGPIFDHLSPPRTI